MPCKAPVFHAVTVSKAAIGTGDFPDTFTLEEQPDVLIRTGLNLRLYTPHQTTLAHLGWATITQVRVVKEHSVEFVMQRIIMGGDKLYGDRHFLVVSKEFAKIGWSCSRWLARCAMTLRMLSKRTTGPQSSPSTASASPPPSPSSALRSRLSSTTSSSASPSPRSSAIKVQEQDIDAMMAGDDSTRAVACNVEE